MFVYVCHRKSLIFLTNKHAIINLTNAAGQRKTIVVTIVWGGNCLGWCVSGAVCV